MKSIGWFEILQYTVLDVESPNLEQRADMVKSIFLGYPEDEEDTLYYDTSSLIEVFQNEQGRLCYFYDNAFHEFRDWEKKPIYAPIGDALLELPTKFSNGIEILNVSDKTMFFDDGDEIVTVNPCGCILDYLTKYYQGARIANNKPFLTNVRLSPTDEGETARLSLEQFFPDVYLLGTMMQASAYPERVYYPLEIGKADILINDEFLYFNKKERF